MSDEDLNRFPPRQTVPNDGLWRRVASSNGYDVLLECGGEERVRIMEGDCVIWHGHRWHAQGLAGALNQAACVKIGE